MKMRFRLDQISYDNLRQQVLHRDGWRCQSCGAMTAFMKLHRVFVRSYTLGWLAKLVPFALAVAWFLR